MRGVALRGVAKSCLTKIRMGRRTNPAGVFPLFPMLPARLVSGMTWQRLLYHMTIFRLLTPRRPGLA